MKKTFKILLAISVISFVAAGCGNFSITKKDQNSQQQTGTIQYKGQNGKNALDLLKAKYPGQVQTQKFSAGEFVQSINGVQPDKNHYWAFYVNGQPATVGAGQYMTKDSDTIEWKLEQSNPNL